MAQSAREIDWSGIIADLRPSGLTHVQFRRLRQIPMPRPATGSIAPGSQ
jgi:hypothetical protein